MHSFFLSYIPDAIGRKTTFYDIYSRPNIFYPLQLLYIVIQYRPNSFWPYFGSDIVINEEKRVYQPQKLNEGK